MKRIYAIAAAGLIATTATVALATPGERDHDRQMRSGQHDRYEKSERSKEAREHGTARRAARYEHREDGDHNRDERHHDRRRSDD